MNNSSECIRQCCSGSTDHAVSIKLPFPKTVFQNIYKNDNKVFKAGDVVDVVIVSHSKFMKKNLNCGKSGGKKPRDNEPWLQAYMMNPSGKGPLTPFFGDLPGESPGSDCRRIAKELFLKPALPCQAAVARCAENFKTKVISPEKYTGKMFSFETPQGCPNRIDRAVCPRDPVLETPYY